MLSVQIDAEAFLCIQNTFKISYYWIHALKILRVMIKPYATLVNPERAKYVDFGIHTAK